MANTYTLISSNTLTSSAASVTFSSIPATYTDLVLRISARDNSGSTAVSMRLQMNSSTGVYSRTRILGNGSTATSAQATAETTMFVGAINDTNSTANTFSNVEIYIPNYQSSSNKPLSSFAAMEDNATAANLNAVAGLGGVTSAITQLVLTTSTNFVSGSSFYLYGIKNS